ncbi:MAG: hypothetical protein MUP13_00315 [Thermoanaerobaculales bacterium]|jgi:hypothetical protein|nr:hypothetical protein [Thermoanaerobaculales bacterium]
MRAAVLPLILMAVSHFAVAEQPSSTVVEEVLAVVGNTPILYSDVTLAALVRLVEPTTEIEGPYRSRLLDARIRLEVEYRDLEESGLLFRLDLEPQRARNTLITRGGGTEVLERELSASGLSWPDLEELALRIAAVDAYVEQRLRPRVSVSMEEIDAAYQELLVAEIATTDEPPPPVAVVQDQLRALLVERKLNEEIERWLVRAGERQEVTRFSR